MICKAKMKKLVAGVMLMGLVVQLIPIQQAKAMAVETKEDIIAVGAVNAKVVRSDLTITGETANCSALVSTGEQKPKISGTIKLKKSSGETWKTVKTWNLSSDRSYLSEKKKYAVTKGKYKLVVSVIITSGKPSETIKRTDTATCK